MTVRPPTRADRKRTGQLSGLQIMFAAILAIGLILGLNFTGLVTSSQPLQQLYDEVSSEIERLETEQANLTRERDYVRSDAYVENWARDEGKMVRPGEVLIVVKPPAEAGAPVAEALPPVDIQTTPPEPESWLLWWELFFDGPPPGA